MLKLQQIVILSLVMGLLLMQVGPAVSRRSSSSGTSASTGTASTEDSTAIAIDIVNLTNFLIQSLFDFFVGILSSIGLCIPQCVDATDCVNCFALSIPPPPALPANIIDPSTITVN